MRSFVNGKKIITLLNENHRINKEFLKYKERYFLEANALQNIVCEKESLFMLLEKKIDEFNLGNRALNVLKNNSIKIVLDLIIKKERELLRKKGCGKITIKEIKEKILNPNNLRFGMEVPKDLF